MLKGRKKHIDKEQGKTKHEAPRSVNYRATQNKNNIGTTALERSVVDTTGGLKANPNPNPKPMTDHNNHTKVTIKYFSHVNLHLRIETEYVLWLRVNKLNDHLFGKELFILFAASAFRKLSSIYVFSYFPFGFEGRIWDLIVSVPDHCLSFYSVKQKEDFFRYPVLRNVLLRQVKSSGILNRFIRIQDPYKTQITRQRNDWFLFQLD